MAITTLNTDTCEKSLIERSWLWSVPKVLWVGIALLLANSAVGIGMMSSGRIHPDPFGSEVQSLSQAGKPSPFARLGDAPRGKVRVAPKLIPIQFEEEPATETAAGF